MSLWSAMVLIVLIVAVAGVIRSRNASNNRAGTQASNGGEQQASRRERELEREVAELRERLQVLERIATDGREAKAIAEEIESLREK